MKEQDEDDLVWEIDGTDTSRRRSTTSTTVQHVHGRSALNVRIVLIAVLALIVGLLSYWAVSQWQIYDAQESVRALIRSQDSAAFAGDVEEVRASLAADDPAWVDWILAQARAERASPLPDPDLVPQVGTPEIVFASLNLEEADVQVYRSFTDASGAVFRYRFDQRYRRIDGQWRRVPVPASLWGVTKAFYGSRLAMQYAEANDDFVSQDLGPEIERLLVRWCSGQPCPGDSFPIRISFVTDLVPIGLTDDGLETGHFLTPRLGGYPIGEAAVERYRLRLTVWSYLEVAERLYLDAAGQPDQARIEFVGVCLRILPGDRDPLACADAGVR